jgi:DUF971 family protein
VAGEDAASPYRAPCWEYFLDLGRHQDAYWRDYLDELAAKGLSRDQ